MWFLVVSVAVVALVVFKCFFAMAATAVTETAAAAVCVFWMFLGSGVIRMIPSMAAAAACV